MVMGSVGQGLLVWVRVGWWFRGVCSFSVRRPFGALLVAAGRPLCLPGDEHCFF